MNLLVGINGVGKSTVLDVLRILFSKILLRTNKRLNFNNSDINLNEKFLDIKLTCEVDHKGFSYSIQKYHKTYQVDSEEKKTQIRFSNAGSWDFHYKIEKTAHEVLALQKEPNSLAIYFSPYRSILNLTKPRLRKNIFSAHFKALEPRQLNLKQFIDWWWACKKLAQEGLISGQSILNALKQAVTEFLGCSNLHVDEKKKTLLIEKSGVTLDVKQLSDGERGVLALVLDLTKRLAQANPYLENPAKEGKAVVLIDELDLHLHPKWQRTIVDQLTRTFPNCQFIATTHSPQIISQVQPKSITFLAREGDQVVVKPATQAYGLDTNWILESLMGVDSRPKPTQELIDQIENLLQEGELELAREILKKLRKMLHGDDGEVIRLEASIDTLEALREDEVDSEEE
jgi:predicted ATP-binding protein involved in virulence